MNSNPKNTDGIFMRRQNQPLAGRKASGGRALSPLSLGGSSQTTHSDRPPVLKREARIDRQAAVANPVAKSKTLDIDLTLDDEKPASKKRKKGLLRGWRPSRKFFKRLAIVLGVLLLLGAGYLAYKVFIASGNIFRGGGQSLLGGDGIDKSKLQHEGDGRINILLAATSEDDPDHPGAILTDSIMIASVDPVNKGVSLVSIPRDLWVEIPDCSMYYREKINAVYQCGEETGFKEQGYPDGGMGLLQKVLEEVTGLNINYYAKINYTAFREAVDAVGGIDITIDSPDPRGIYDPNFDWICRYACTKVKWPNGQAHLDGEHALYLARSRNSAGGYGMPRGDFDRTEYQRKMLLALKDKAASVETLSNPVRLSALIDSIGNNIVTNFSRDDMIKLYGIAKDISADYTKSIGLADEDVALLTTGNAGGASVVQPSAGLFAYDALHGFLRKELVDPYIISEAPAIAVYNGAGVGGLASQQKEVLESYGYKVVLVGDAPTADYPQTAFYDTTGGKKEITRQYLQNRYQTQAQTGNLPEGILGTYDSGETDETGNPLPPKTADYVIILGSNL
jgi:LCP family protein required for cell wall assembly